MRTDEGRRQEGTSSPEPRAEWSVNRLGEGGPMQQLCLEGEEGCAKCLVYGVSMAAHPNTCSGWQNLIATLAPAVLTRRRHHEFIQYERSIVSLVEAKAVMAASYMAC